MSYIYLKLNRVIEKIDEANSQLTQKCLINMEADKLKDASKQVKFKLDKLDRKQKKILCNMFIDKIEMRRTKAPRSGKKKWNTDAQIYFRFNPNKLSDEDIGGRTEKELNKNKKGGKKAKKGKNGVKGGI